MRSHGCGDLRQDATGQAVQLCGWVDRSRDHGGVIFVDLRDRSGTVQITVDPDNGAEMFVVAEHLRNETVIQVRGTVRERPADAINDKLDPVRISSDLKDKVNPYWIEVGAGRIFEFRDTIVVRADSRRFALIYNGHLIRSLNEFRFDADSLNFRLTRTLLQHRPESQRSGSLPEGVRPPILDF